MWQNFFLALIVFDCTLENRIWNRGSGLFSEPQTALKHRNSAVPNDPFGNLILPNRTETEKKYQFYRIKLAFY